MDDEPEKKVVVSEDKREGGESERRAEAKVVFEGSDFATNEVSPEGGSRTTLGKNEELSPSQIFRRMDSFPSAWALSFCCSVKFGLNRNFSNFPSTLEIDSHRDTHYTLSHIAQRYHHVFLWVSHWQRKKETEEKVFAIFVVTVL